MDLDEPVIGQPERAGEVEQTVEQRADQCPAVRERQPERHHHGQKERSGERESLAGTPQRRKLTVAEPDIHRIAIGEHGIGHKCDERHPLAIGVVTSETLPSITSPTCACLRRAPASCGRQTERPRTSNRRWARLRLPKQDLVVGCVLIGNVGADGPRDALAAFFLLLVTLLHPDERLGLVGAPTARSQHKCAGCRTAGRGSSYVKFGDVILRVVTRAISTCQ
jgi:hypothetical protein